jgi:hypothetical protein
LCGCFGLSCSLGRPACATPAWKRSLHDRYFQRVAPPKLHPIPETRDPSGWWERAWQSLRPLGEAISPEHHLRALSGGAPALDVNSFGQVPDSSWFVNRINRKALTPEQIRRGPNTVDGPAPGPLIIVGGKIRGNTPGLIARDAANERWVIKFDPPALPRDGIRVRDYRDQTDARGGLPCSAELPRLVQP